ncbi:MAG: hypothetical protein AAFQ80_16030 [Cyanobacteria bacterium J06621_8]
MKQWLISIYVEYHQEFQCSVESDVMISTIESKITLVNSSSIDLNSSGNNLQWQSPAHLLPIVYACPLAILIAASEKLSLSMVMENLQILLKEKLNNITDKSTAKISYLIIDSGWFNFYLHPQMLAHWLQKLLSQVNLGRVNYDGGASGLTIAKANKLSNSFQLLPAQFIHARCCSVMNLGARAKLMTNWQLPQSTFLVWFNEAQNLWSIRLSEYNLLRDLIIVTDRFASQPRSNWSKTALSLSQTTAIFLADCRIFGEVQQRFPQQAIARLGLIAIVQHWLGRILEERLNLPAPTEL